jgi:hypothetical protein
VPSRPVYGSDYRRTFRRRRAVRATLLAIRIGDQSTDSGNGLRRRRGEANACIRSIRSHNPLTVLGHAGLAGHVADGIVGVRLVVGRRHRRQRRRSGSTYRRSIISLLAPQVELAGVP